MIFLDINIFFFMFLIVINGILVELYKNVFSMIVLLWLILYLIDNILIYLFNYYIDI